MKKRWRIGLMGLFLGMVFLGIVTIHTIIKVQSYGQLINYVGIVCGATQRLVKLELQGIKSDELMTYLDDILDNLMTGEGKYDLVLLPDELYLEKLNQLNSFWSGTIKDGIGQYREDPKILNQLLNDSETYFILANQTVFAAQDYSGRQTTMLTVLIIVIFAGMLLVWAFVLRDDTRRILHLESKNKDLSDKADRDTLTDAYTFDSFKRMAQELLDKHQEHKYAVFYMDFEDFKYINDVFGYSYGDDILKMYSKIIQSDLASGETFGRVNADNFVALRAYNHKDELLIRQKKLDFEITNFMKNSYAKHSLPINCGICCIEDVVENLKIEGLLDRANFARKTVKQGIYKNYSFYDESIRQNLWEENSIRSHLENAFANHEFVVYYQPKVQLSDEHIICAEALVRWKMADGKIIGPDKFIPILEKDRNIASLDQYVFGEVCRWLKSMIDAGKKPLPVSVNVSRLQFYNPDFVDTYVKLCDRHGLSKSLLEIEFTETIAFDNTPLLLEIVADLKKAGFSCSIDDFGKGYSSLGLLKSLPVDVLKIDSQFFANIDGMEKNRMIVEGIIDIMRRLNITTVAEGIETSEQVAFLKNVHCDIVQGYYYYRPMPQEDYETLLEKVR